MFLPVSNQNFHADFIDDVGSDVIGFYIAGVAGVQQKWNEIVPYLQFDYTFLDDF